MDFENRPDELRAGDYILIAKPEGGGGASQYLIDAAKIGVGKIGEFMGALNKKDVWRYTAPSWEEKQEKKRRWQMRSIFGRK